MTSLHHGLFLQAVAIQSILGAINHLRSTVGNIGNMVSTILMATHTSAATAGPALQAVMPDTAVGTPLSVAEHLVGGTTTDRSIAPPHNALQGLMAPSGRAGHELELTGMLACDFFLKVMKQGGAVGAVKGERAERLKAVTCFDMFSGMMTDEERAQLAPPAPGARGQPPTEQGQQRVLVQKLERLVIAYLVERFKETQDGAVPKSLQEPTSKLLVSSLSSRLAELRKKGVTVVTGTALKSILSEWRSSRGLDLEVELPPAKKRRHGR